MSFDLSTLLVTSQLVAIVCGALFLVEALRGKTASNWWFAGAFLCAPAAPVFYLAAANSPQLLWSYPFGNGVASMTAALMWAGARGVNGRSTPWWVVLAVPAAKIAVVLAVSTELDAWSGAHLFFLAFGILCLLAGAEFFRGKDGEPRLGNATILATTCVFSALYFFSRFMGLLLLGSEHQFFRAVLGPETSTLILMLAIVISSFCVIALGKERTDLLIHHAASHDSLTDLLNRREFLCRATEIVRASSSGRTWVAVLLFDIDHFKKINDSHGHVMGDRVLVAFAAVCRANVRDCDLLCRYGGEEFAAVFPDVTRQQAFEIAERIRSAFSSLDDPCLASIRPTTSIGIVHAPAGTADLDGLIEGADKCLYGAKASGRNRTLISSDIPEEVRRYAKIVTTHAPAIAVA